MKKALLVLLLLLCVISFSEAKKSISIKKLRYATYKSHTRIVLDLSGSPKFSKNILSNPDRLFFDIKGEEFSLFFSKKVYEYTSCNFDHDSVDIKYIFTTLPHRENHLYQHLAIYQIRYRWEIN